jgi:thiamine-monophosphate kinase
MGDTMGELGLLHKIRLRASQTPAPELRLGIGDDCAILRPGPGEEFAVTTDLSIDGRHFRLDWHPAESVGHRALARGLSDLAAMGARPVAAFLSLALPRDLVQKPKTRSAPKSAWPAQTTWPSPKGRKSQAARGVWPSPKGRDSQAARGVWIDQFLDGFLSLAQEHQTTLAGGDLAESTLAVADVVLTGVVPQGEALLRSGARAGDLIYVTGSLGAAAVGLQQLTQLAAALKRPRPKPSALPGISPRFMALLTPHLYPTPRVAQGLWLARNAMATAAIDLSDGLSTDLAHLCAESGVAAELDAAALPFAPGATAAQALNGGEDYELLFTAPAAARVPSSIEGVVVTQIGRIVDAREGASKRSSPPITLITRKGAVSLAPQGWQHFS